MLKDIDNTVNRRFSSTILHILIFYKTQKRIFYKIYIYICYIKLM